MYFGYDMIAYNYKFKQQLESVVLFVSGINLKRNVEDFLRNDLIKHQLQHLFDVFFFFQILFTFNRNI